MKKRIKNVPIKAENAVQYAVIGKFFNAECYIFKLFSFVHESSKGLYKELKQDVPLRNRLLLKQRLQKLSDGIIPSKRVKFT
ncbi:MAG: hypothetical protein R3E90_08430 [Marinicella sp.]